MTYTVIYHRADFDGIFCREIAKMFLPEATLIGWDFGDLPIEPPNTEDDVIYVLDLPVDRVFGWRWGALGLVETGLVPPDLLSRIIWIDHHQSSIATHPKYIQGYRIDGVAACRLAWQWFSNFLKGEALPVKQDFIDRTVKEPLAVRLAGEYDIWDKRDPDAALFQHGLRSCDLTENMWDLLLSDQHAPTPDGKRGIGEIAVESLLESGEAVQFAKAQENEAVINEMGFTLKFEDLTFLACNAAMYNSHLFTAGLKPEHDACLGFKWKRNEWSVSLYHAPGKEHLDLSVIAKKYGGGGHKGACGFQAAQLPFPLA